MFSSGSVRPTDDDRTLRRCDTHTHKFVDHVHFHVIPKPSDSKTEGLVIEWPQKTVSKDELADVQAELKSKL